MGRAPALWSEENTKLIQENFVAVSLTALECERNDAVGQFLRDAGMKIIAKLEVSLWCVTAGGEVLQSTFDPVKGFKPDFDVKGALEKWQALPAAERAPGAVKVGEMGAVDPQRAGLTPPAGTLILKLHYRAFMRDGNQLRYLTGKDLWYDAKGAKTESDPGTTKPQAQLDHMWLSEAEGKSLMPANPRSGDKFPLPAGIAERLVRRHLNPRSMHDGHSDGLDRGAVRAAELNLTVEAVSAERVRLRLDGHAKLGSQPDAEVLAGIAGMTQWGYEPKLLGFLEYEPQQQVFTRFDIVALGDHFGRFVPSFGVARPGCQPLGVTFELVKGDRPANRVPPGSASTARKYFEPLR